MKRELTPKQRQFVLEYLVDRNETQAAIRAGYSKKTAYAAGCRLLKNVYIKRAIDAAIAAQEKRTGISADKILTELAKVAFLDIAGAFTEDGALKPIHDMPQAVRAAIAGIDIDELYEGHGKDRKHVGQTKRLKLSDKLRALELLGKNLKLFTDKHEVDLPGGATVLFKVVDA